ncbi:MAG: hypothetical protein AAF968_17530 [Pseudomonadota bacterium]
MTRPLDTDRLGFDGLLAAAETDNRERRFARKTEHLPETMEAAAPAFATLIDAHHAAMLAADVDEAMRLREEARLMAQKLDPERRGILAHDNAPGYALMRTLPATGGGVPLWGQDGTFQIDAAGMTVRIEMEGVFGIGASFGFWPGFAAHAVHWDRPFLSATGYRSFLGIHADAAPGLTPDVFARMIVERYVADALGGTLEPISAHFVEPRDRDEER